MKQYLDNAFCHFGVIHLQRLLKGQYNNLKYNYGSNVRVDKKIMKWTTLRLNMLPITAVEVQYACQTLTHLHNALVDAISKQSPFLSKSASTHSKPIFSSSESFLPVTVHKSSILQGEDTLPQQMTYEKVKSEYEKLKRQIRLQIDELKRFYVRNSHDSSASLFHMLRLRLERTLFDCNLDKMKKVLTKNQQQNEYKQIARHFQSNSTSKIEQSNAHTKRYSQKELLQSWDTFKTENYAGYQNDSGQISENEFLQVENTNFQKLNFDVKPQSKKYISETNMKPQSKSKISLSPANKNPKSANIIKPSDSKTLFKKQTTSEITIATQNEKQKITNVKQPKANLNKIQNFQNSYKNIKVLTTNNVQVKSFAKNEVETKIPRQNFSNMYNGVRKVAPNQKPNQVNDKPKGYGAINIKKQEQKRKVIDEKQTETPDLSIKTQQVSLNTQAKGKSKSPLTSVNKRLSPKKVTLPDKVKGQISPMNNPNTEQSQVNDLKKMLISNGSQLRFTIKMSREEYRSLLQLKSKMTNKNG